MAYRSLREFLVKLEAAGELVRVTEPVSSHLEMTEIQRRLLKGGGPAVLFENVIRADAPPPASCARWASCWRSCGSPSRRAA